jgi:EAL domain-containing protein (putative c-di-GMP-specific phosphodiesterase class I)
MRDAEATARRLRSLKRLGVRIAIDDFETGYSSLATLVQLGESLEVETLAEGIEGDTQLQALQREHCGV